MGAVRRAVSAIARDRGAALGLLVLALVGVAAVRALSPWVSGLLAFFGVLFFYVPWGRWVRWAAWLAVSSWSVVCGLASLRGWWWPADGLAGAQLIVAGVLMLVLAWWTRIPAPPVAQMAIGPRPAVVGRRGDGGPAEIASSSTDPAVDRS